MLKNDRWIIRMAREKGMIEPFEPAQVKSIDGKPVISYGVSSYGYDIRLAKNFKVLDPQRLAPGSRLQVPGQSSSLEPRASSLEQAVIDPKNFDISAYVDSEGEICTLPAHGMAIVQSLEWFRIPREVLVICNGKSTYARCGIHVALAPLEPEWEGRLTFAITNHNALPANIYANEGIAQLLFLESDEVCQTSYADRQGKYQKQTVLTPPKV